MTDANRLSVKIAGESGQGINSIGEMVAKALKQNGFYTFGYREYPSLIKGGYAFHQIDFSDHSINSSSRQTDILLCFSRVALHTYLPSLRAGGQVIHMLPQLELSDEEQQEVKKNNIKISYLPAPDLAVEAGGREIMANVVIVGALWKLMSLSLTPLSEILAREFSHKPEMVAPNLACLKKGYDFKQTSANSFKIHFKSHDKRKDDALLTGNNLLGLGAVAAGVRAYFAYPMTPSSSILSYMANIYHDTGILVKQLDDEISVAQFALGAMFMGTRALVATSGGGFDLMTESVSLSAMTETPFVCILGQRPGPATGMPTWTAASDLNLAVYAGHGEFPRCVIAISDSKSAYIVIQNAFNIAEKYQIPVIVLTEKQIAESLFQLDNLAKDVEIKRNLVTGRALENLTPYDRFKITKSGISPRWLPGDTEATFVGNSDEHLEDGTVTEDAQPASKMISKRLRKLQALQEDLPEPELVGPPDAKLTFVGWGSVKNTFCDTMDLWNKKHQDFFVNFLHYEYIYPTKVEKLKSLIAKGQPLALIENNASAELGTLLSQHTQYDIKDKLLKFDGRPFFIEDILEHLEKRFSKK